MTRRVPELSPGRPLHRRTVLRGLLGGAAVGVGLPLFDLFVHDNGHALADHTGFPKRFGWWFFGNGIHAEKWTPAGDGPTWEPSPQLLPLAALKSEITVLSGLKVYLPNTVPHGSGPAGILTGGPLGKVGDSFDNSTFGGATLDQIIAQTIGNDTRFRSIEVAVERSLDSLSYSGPGQTNPPEDKPFALYQRIFGAGFVAPGDTPILDPKLALRRSVLDAISSDSLALKKRLGQADKIRLEQHYDNIRALEKQLKKLEEDPPNLASCGLPATPEADYPDLEGRPQMSAISRVMSDMLAMALACDQTRVASVMFSRPVSGVLYPGASDSHHKLTHDELGQQPKVHAIILQIIEELAYFLEALRKVPEGDATLLEHSAILCMSDCSFGKSHAIDNYPLLLAGGADGALKKGIHYKSPSAENASRLGFTLLRAMGVPVTEFGAAEGLVTQGLEDIEG